VTSTGLAVRRPGRARRDERKRPSRRRSVTPIAVATSSAATRAHSPATSPTMTVGPVEFPAHQRARPASRPSPGRGIRQTKRSWRVRTSTPLVTFKRHATAPARKRASVLPGPLRAGAALCCLVRSVRTPRSGPFPRFAPGRDLRAASSSADGCSGDLAAAQPRSLRSGAGPPRGRLRTQLGCVPLHVTSWSNCIRVALLCPRMGVATWHWFHDLPRPPRRAPDRRRRPVTRVAPVIWWHFRSYGAEDATRSWTSSRSGGIFGRPAHWRSEVTPHDELHPARNVQARRDRARPETCRGTSRAGLNALRSLRGPVHFRDVQARRDRAGPEACLRGGSAPERSERGWAAAEAAAGHRPLRRPRPGGPVGAKRVRGRRAVPGRSGPANTAPCPDGADQATQRTINIAPCSTSLRPCWRWLRCWSRGARRTWPTGSTRASAD